MEEAPDRFTTLAPLLKQPGVKATEVGRLSGINLEELPPATRQVFHQIPHETDKLK